MSGYVTFQLGSQELACPLHDVREVVRLNRMHTLPGLNAGVSGLLELRGSPLPVVDVRTDAQSRGDVLVLQAETLGVVVDRVTGVITDDVLVPASVRPERLPGYVRDVLVDVTRGEPVLLVDLHALAAVSAG
ncbi:CheW protein [Acidothermus cellulolyticus 11B]|uniref:CheW protein n=1 Tax=Acidothermus cellulolyticus (strain ATCC 43068 / DSM 8971 / 11B) TaxID=351607 RepID=A0LRD8_ACIC1|nr:chemotaxis protein CheW [Acidothermus cellulolyticus]ABK51998.1 CheW protein [Acidothermus cellulolyticus 11B]MBX5447555.1 chemotaxis protein CheW [Acidothermus cellulolyticus]MCL6549800.1 chemotaxis protein CheW [Acidothermus cellulolyticus]